MKKISVGWNKYALVDDEDYNMLMEYKWRTRMSGGKRYAVSKGSYNKSVIMHRLILGLTDSKVYCDHINGFTLNNQRCNLRAVTPSQNQMNKKASGASKYLGVSWRELSKKWISQITVYGKKKYLGSFDSELEAAIIYNIVARRYYGEFANPNIF